MPYMLRKAPKRELYWVITKETGRHHSIEPLPKEDAIAQMRALYVAMEREPVPASDVAAAKKFEKTHSLDVIRNAVLEAECKKIDKSLVLGFTKKEDLLKYLRKINCPILIRIEAELERKL
jgi:hypothetical protein